MQTAYAPLCGHDVKVPGDGGHAAALRESTSMFRRASLALVLWVPLVGASHPLASNDPYVIYDRAREAWAKESYPVPLRYRITIGVVEGEKLEQQHFDGETSFDGDIRVFGVSEEEQQQPHVATGINFRLTFQFGWNTHTGGQTATATVDAHRKESSPDYLGVPLLSPSYSFGIAAIDDKPKEAAQGSTSSLPVIGHVEAFDRPYEITLDGIDPVDGRPAYHLLLKPRSHPEKYRLRELWLNADTYEAMKLLVQGNFQYAPSTDVPWLVTFQDIGGLTYIEKEVAEKPLVYRHDRTFASATISFDKITTDVSRLPVLPNMSLDGALMEP
jgi:hypothetical protein